jgi:hypothetical protein
MPGSVAAITKTSLWKSWKAIRKELKHSSVRDVVDFLEYDVDPDVWINRLLFHISKGMYEPTAPQRFTLGKSTGLSRRMTFPSIPDLVLYRTIVDFLYIKARRDQHDHVFFLRDQVHSAKTGAQKSAGTLMGQVAADYRLRNVSSFLNWLRYDQYRKYLLFKKIYPYFVVTDIANFFDSVLHTHVGEVLRRFAAPPRLIGLLFFLLERLALREDYTHSAGMGLPVDEFDCSRTLAHLVLFPHDDALTKLVGEDAYVRWMDDQNIGAPSRSRALKVLVAIGDSLACLHLTANAKKTKVLSLKEARRHFHLDLNRSLDDVGALLGKKRIPRRRVALEVKKIWRRAKKHEGVGEWGKVLARIYRFAGIGRTPILRSRALQDSLRDPAHAERFADYMRCSGSPSDYLVYAQKLLSHGEQVYPDVAVAIFESFLRVEASPRVASSIRALARDELRRAAADSSRAQCAVVSALLLLRFGDRRSLPVLRRCFEIPQVDKLWTAVVRAAGIVYASYGIDEFRSLRKAAARLLRNHLAEMVRLIERVRGYKQVPGRFKSHLDLGFDAVKARKFVDMRSLLSIRLLALSANAQVRAWVSTWKRNVLKSSLSGYDKKLVRRLLPGF